METPEQRIERRAEVLWKAEGGEGPHSKNANPTWATEDEGLRRQYIALARAIEASDATQGWQPIESAPKDGTPILGFFPDQVFSAITGIDVIWFEASEGGWLLAGERVYDPPTHFMPLPAPPKE